MFKGILTKSLAFFIVSSLVLTLIGCEEVTSQISSLTNKEETTAIVGADYNIVFMFSQVNKNDIEVLDTISSLRDEYGFLSETIILDDDSKITSSLRTVVENKADLVVGYGQSMAIVFDLFEDTYPDTKYVVIDGQAQDDDIKSISFDNDAVSYALGVMVATAFEGVNDFGYIGDFDNDNNLEYKSGFIKGLKSINKNASIDIEYVDSSKDYETAYELTTYYQSMGVKFVMGATNPTINQGIYQACNDLAQEGKYIYTNAFLSDVTNSNTSSIISGIIKDYNAITEDVVNDFIHGKFTSKNIEIAVGDDAFQLLDVTSQSANHTNKDILNENSIKAGRKVLEDIKNKNLIL